MYRYRPRSDRDHDGVWCCVDGLSIRFTSNTKALHIIVTRKLVHYRKSTVAGTSVVLQSYCFKEYQLITDNKRRRYIAVSEVRIESADSKLTNKSNQQYSNYTILLVCYKQYTDRAISMDEGVLARRR